MSRITENIDGKGAFKTREEKVAKVQTLESTCHTLRMASTYLGNMAHETADGHGYLLGELWEGCGWKETKGQIVKRFSGY